MVLRWMHWKPVHDSAALPGRPTGPVALPQWHLVAGREGSGCIKLSQLLPGVQNACSSRRRMPSCQQTVVKFMVCLALVELLSTVLCQQRCSSTAV